MWAIPHGSTVAQLRLRLSETHPALNTIAAHLFVAIDGDYAADEMELANGDEVAFFPPVSGG
ncbi:MAG: MoaD/ThiS family protein [Planctomycetaceae bacterium]|nr:MoaD/ThiS family protein [Planctomycetaceae bacterium]